MRLQRGAALVAAGFTLLTIAEPVRAQSSNSEQVDAARRGLLDDANASSRRGDHAHALELAERAAQLSMTPSLRLFIAREQTAVGQLAEAVGSADACIREAGGFAALNNREAIIAECRHILGELSPRLGSVVVQMPSPVPDGALVHIGTASVPPALYGVPFRVTPGTVAVDVTAPGRTAFHASTAVGAGASATVVVTLAVAPANTATTSSSIPDDSASSTAPAAARTASATSASSGSPAPGSTRSARTSGAHATGAIVVTVVGIAALLAGGVFLGVSYANIGSVESNDCVVMGGAYHCYPSAVSAVSNADSFQDIGIGALIGGGVIAVAGIAWILASGPSEEHAAARLPRWHFGVLPTREGGLLTIGGEL